MLDTSLFANAHGVTSAVRNALAMLRPPPDLPPSQWAEANVRIPTGNAIPGPYRIANAPYQREPMDMFVNPDCYRVTLEWGAQVGKTLTLLCIQGYAIDMRPRSQMMMQPSQGDAQTWLETKFNPLVEASPGIARRIAKPRARDGVNNQRMKSYHFIRQGIEFNRYGRPVAYHFSSTDEADSYWYSINGRGFVRVPADEVIHRFRVEMVGQRRGLPWTSTSLARLHHLAGFEDASVQNACATATKMGFIKYRDGFGPSNDDDVNVAETIDAEPLSFHELPEGAELAEWNPNYPSNEFAVFCKSMLRGASAGWGVLYNNVAGDLEGVNFSSIRQGTLDERENWKEIQQWLIESLISDVFHAWLKVALLRGDIVTKSGKPYGAENLTAFGHVKWLGRRWAWIDPRADVDSATSSIRGGLMSFSQVIREQGRDPMETYREIADDLKQMAAAGIPEKFIELFLNGVPTPPPPVEPATSEHTA